MRERGRQRRPAWTTASRGHPLPQKFRGELFTLMTPQLRWYFYDMSNRPHPPYSVTSYPTARLFPLYVS